MSMIDLSAKRITGAVVRLNPDDNVVVARIPLAPGAEIPEEGVTCRENVQAGYKIAARAIAKGEPIRKYNVTIGFAAEDIPAGALGKHFVLRVRPRLRLLRRVQTGRDGARGAARVLHGHRARRRPGGDAQIRRHPVDRQLLGDGGAQGRRIFHPRAPGGEYPNIDGVAASPTATGCGMELTGEPMSTCCAVPWRAMQRHPNLAAC